MRASYVIARNASKRPTLMHKVSRSTARTVCGRDISRWSRSFHSRPIEVMLCLSCKAHG